MMVTRAPNAIRQAMADNESAIGLARGNRAYQVMVGDGYGHAFSETRWTWAKVQVDPDAEVEESLDWDGKQKG